MSRALLLRQPARPAGTLRAARAGFVLLTVLSSIMVGAALWMPLGLAQPPFPAPQARHVEADTSTRHVAVTSNFAGTEILVFGAFQRPEDNGASHRYDVVVVMEGEKTPLMARRKGYVGGVWLNTQALRFEAVPGFYAIVSTRPLAEIADTRTFEQYAIGLDYLVTRPARGADRLSAREVQEYTKAVVRLKQREKLFMQDDYGVTFNNRQFLFRATVPIPANAPVGQLTARIFLFRDNAYLTHQDNVRVQFRREGLEWFLHTFATRYAVLYGVCVVLLAVGIGLLASLLISRLGLLAVTPVLSTPPRRK